MNISFDFKNKTNIHDILDIMYQTINDLWGAEIMHRGRRDKEVWDAYYDDLFCVLTDSDFIARFGNKIHFILKGLSELKKEEPENYKMFLESTIGYQVEEIATNKYVNGKVSFSYEIQQ
ncbi:MAG: hypothetical protein A3D35_01720 [Candidatus Staskawiczbacteria bacterium RIFCSPHIGHO2_02_FULL_34_9]|uniref:Barstar (barnase inhibitor) domain-containing protein n=1 Tax=Candidatus Staskawiczbacteria bacterium RIFCSPHIGHO2_02_FULL_34_9 TaxID=1802206 RepID=A0A1G2HY23_9BACT|nr:MAG: hypothetical protein A3D35_01720 [Candidatus Staskawiczbacteria bacterium RIFCSPHIGHO2_02_FULL_34_9]